MPLPTKRAAMPQLPWDQIPWTRRICLQEAQSSYLVQELEACFNDTNEQPFVNDCILAIEFLNLPPERPISPTTAALVLHYHIDNPTDSQWAWPALFTAHYLRITHLRSTTNLLRLWTTPIEWSPCHHNNNPLKWGIRLLQQLTEECERLHRPTNSSTAAPPPLRRDHTGRLLHACNQCASITHNRCPFCNSPLCHLCHQYNITIDRHQNCHSLNHFLPPDMPTIFSR